MLRFQITRLIAPAVLALALAPPLARAADTAPVPAPATISVTGIGAVMLAPDVADLSIDARSGAFSATVARSRANAKTQRILAAIVRLGVDRGAIQTSGISLARTQMSRPHHRAIPFFTASNSLALHLTDVKLVGPIVDAATAAGADNIDGPNYSFANPSTGRGQATRAALADARARADAAAAATGYHVSGVSSIDIDPQDAPTPRLDSASGVGSAPAAAKVTTPTPTSPGRDEVDSTVRVVYLIAPN